MNSSLDVNCMAENNTLIDDFDREVATRIEMIRTGAENVSANMINALDLTLLSFPEPVRKMPIKALVVNFNGDLQMAAQYFAPKVKKHSTKKHRSKKVDPSSLQSMSLSDLLKKKETNSSNDSMNLSCSNNSKNIPKSASSSTIKFKTLPRTAKRPPTKSPPRSPIRSTRIAPKIPSARSPKSNK